MEKIRIYGLKDAFSCMYSFSKETARKQVIDIYASLKVLPRKYLEKDLFSPMHFGQSKKEIRENKINNFKHRINRFTDKITRPFRQIKKETERKDYEFGPLVEYKKNPFELKISTKASDKKRTEDRELEAYIKAKFLINNIEEVDLDQFFYNYAYDDQIINEFFNLLPDNKKSALCNRFFSILTSNGNYNDYIVKKYIETFKKNISHEDLVELYIYNNLDIENQEIQITDNDIIYYYLKHNGNIPFGYSERFEKIIENGLCIHAAGDQEHGSQAQRNKGPVFHEFAKGFQQVFVLLIFHRGDILPCQLKEEEIDHHAEHSQNDNSAEELVLIQNLGASGNRGENKQRKHHL